ncbi:MAG: CHAT domain-containing protein [Chloroflexota bacterium]|jgi:hypothetical protein
MDYDNFNIQIGRPEGVAGFIMSVTSNRGTLDQRPITYAEEEARLRDRIEINEDGSLAREEDIRALGEVLRKRLLPSGEVWSFFSRTREETITGQGIEKGLRIRLTIDRAAAVFSQLPWEYLFDDVEDRTFIGLNDRTPIIRSLSGGLKLRSLEAPQPRVLVAVASPDNDKLAPLYKLGIRNRVKTIFEELEKEGYANPDLLFHASLEELTRRVDNNEYDIFQFLGHGRLHPDYGPRIYLEGVGRKQQLVEHWRLVNLLAGKFKLCLLTSCESSAEPSVYDPGQMFTGLAQELVQAKIPAVVGMQLKIDQKWATNFTREFYKALVSSPVDEALVKARRAAYSLQVEERIETHAWGIPVLYLQSEDGRVWPDQSAMESAAKTKEMVQRGEAALDEPQERRPKEVDNLLEALSTLNFDKQLTTFRAVRSANRAKALVLGGGGAIHHCGLAWLSSALLRDIRWKTGKSFRCVNLTSTMIGGDIGLMWGQLAIRCKVAPGDPAEIAQAVVQQLDTHSMVFLLEYDERNIHMETLLNEFWSKMVQCASKLPRNECLKQTALLLLILDKDDRLADSDYELLTKLPPIEPISESTFMTWHRASERLLPASMRDDEVARHILLGGQNGYPLPNTQGHVDRILMNLNFLCEVMLEDGILDKIGK